MKTCTFRALYARNRHEQNMLNAGRIISYEKKTQNLFSHSNDFLNANFHLNLSPSAIGPGDVNERLHFCLAHTRAYFGVLEFRRSSHTHKSFAVFSTHVESKLLYYTTKKGTESPLPPTENTLYHSNIFKRYSTRVSYC